MAEECVAFTTTASPVTDLASFLGGFVAAEGCFTRGAPQSNFRFSIGLGAVDAGMCTGFLAFLDCGSTYWYRRRKQHYDDEAVFTVQRTRDLVEIVVPFMDAHLPPSYKREQYLKWRADLLEYWHHRRRR